MPENKEEYITITVIQIDNDSSRMCKIIGDIHKLNNFSREAVVQKMLENKEIEELRINIK